MSTVKKVVKKGPPAFFIIPPVRASTVEVEALVKNAVKKKGLTSFIIPPSIEEIQEFLETVPIFPIQLSQIDTEQLQEKVAATEEILWKPIDDIIEGNAIIKRPYDEEEKIEERLLKKSHDLHKVWSILSCCMEQIKMRRPRSTEAIVALIHDYIHLSENKPIKWDDGNLFTWLFKGFCYSVNGLYSDEQCKLLIRKEFKKESDFFDGLKIELDPERQPNPQTRNRIPAHVRIEVWRRDGGKCARCGNREKLEYDHIVPRSRGGGNTARNIELLCEKCNRTKGANIG